MKPFLTLIFLMMATTHSYADLSQAQNYMRAGRFQETMLELLPAAQSGNADAAQMIGVLYGLGLGVDQDDTRAFEWYLRAAMQGHPGAGAAVAYHYETGKGLQSPDLMRAYMWYVLADIGGDADAALGQEEVLAKISDEQISKAHILIDDYKVTLFPFE